MSASSITVTRRVPSSTATGEAVDVALATITHESGVQQTVAIREDKIKFEGGGDEERERKFILKEVDRAMQSPQAPQLAFVPKGKKK